MDALRTMDARALMRHLGVPAWKMPFIANYARKRKSQELAETRLFDGVDRMLRRLAGADIALALVSSNSESNVRAILGAENASLIRTYECGASLFGKAARFRKVLRRSGVPASDAICIGDEIRDLEATRKEGIAFGAVNWGYTTPKALIARQPAAVFGSVDAVADLFVRWQLAKPNTGQLRMDAIYPL